VWQYFHQVWYWAVLLKFCQAILISCRRDNFNCQITWRPLHTSLAKLTKYLSEEYFKQSCTENKMHILQPIHCT
jgi:hypothetical protein